MIWCYDIRIIMWQFTFIINLARIYMIRFLFILIFFLMGEKKRFYQRRYKKSPPQLTPHTFIIDKLPLIEKRQPLDYKKLLEEYNLINGKQLTPIKRRKNSTNVNPSIRCIWCNAPHEYIYINNGGKGQYLCKVCGNTFFKTSKIRKITYKCPYCFHVLQPVKVRKSFIVFKCCHKKCPYRQKMLKQLSRQQRKLRHYKPYLFKINYIYREFNFDLEKCKPSSPNMPHIDLAKIHNPLAIVGLSLYYYMNLGLSARQTKQALKELYDVAISHQTILNYIEAAAYRLTPLTENTSIHIEGDFVTDETYITIQGNWGYVIFTYVPHKNIITTQHVCLQRDVQAAWTSLLNHLSQIDPRLLTDPIIHLLWVTDGNPIYKLAHQFAQQYGLHFQHKLVIGLKNSDPESFEYRVFKQFIERLNRTYKEKYRKTCGFKSFNLQRLEG